MLKIMEFESHGLLFFMLFLGIMIVFFERLALLLCKTLVLIKITGSKTVVSSCAALVDT